MIFINHFYKDMQIVIIKHIFKKLRNNVYV